MATNLVPVTDEILDFLAAHSVLVSTSLDGPAFIHNANRPRPGRDSHAIVVANIERARRALGHDRISAIMTTSALSLQHPIEIVEEYVRLGFTAISCGPSAPMVSPCGPERRGGMSWTNS